MEYLVSILVPIYNVEHYIERCARSLFEQTYSNLEFVFVDDCSKDGSIVILNHVIDEFPERKSAVKLIKHNMNRGLAASRNTALDNAHGDFVCSVDSDDWLELDAIEKLVKKQIATHADIVAGNMIMHTCDGDVKFQEKKCTNKVDLVLLQMQKTWDHTVCRKLIRRSLYEEYGIRCIEGCDMTEDRYQMTQLTYFSSKYEQIDDYIYHYDRKNTTSIMNQNDSSRLLKKNFQYLQNWIGIRDFFGDKETIFLEEANNKMLQFANCYYLSSLRFHSRDWFNRIAALLDKESENNQEKIGWTKNGLKGFYLHCFPCSEVGYQINRMIKFFLRTFNFRLSSK